MKTRLRSCIPYVIAALLMCGLMFAVPAMAKGADSPSGDDSAATSSAEAQGASGEVQDASGDNSEGSDSADSSGNSDSTDGSEGTGESGAEGETDGETGAQGEGEGGTAFSNDSDNSSYLDDKIDHYDVWFDGTVGMEKLIAGSSKAGLSYYYSGATDTHVQVSIEDGEVTLPETAGSPEKYDYVLNGWYDVTNKKYYSKDKLGTKISISGSAVFYADWVPANYNLGTSSRAKVSNQPDTSDFITTRVYDYNELFNLRSADSSQTSLTSDTHSEHWQLNQGSLDFAFLNWAYNDAAGYTNIASLANLDSKNQNKDDITPSILTDLNKDSLLNALFGQSSNLGRTYVGTGDYLYQYVEDSSDEHYGYYYYDSAKNGASYNQKDGRFYLYEQTEMVNKQKRVGNTWVDTGKQVSAFLPFNDNESGIYNEKDGSINYWFGMQSSIDFWLPNDSGTGGNKADTGKDMEFQFSGDDDVWVFVDDQLVLDLGGIHGARGGSINFSTGEVKTEVSKDNWTTEDLPTVKAGNHTLTIYYLERGSSESNCSIYFNIAPKYALTLAKKDSESGKALEGAKFGVYTDAACSKPAELWDNVEEKGSSVNEFKTSENGSATAYGLVAGNTYYVKELKAPEGYDCDTAKVYTITLNKDGTVEKQDGVDLVADSSSKKLTLTVNNTKKDVTPDPDPDPEPSPDPDPDNPDDGTDETPDDGTDETPDDSTEPDDSVEKYSDSTEKASSDSSSKLPETGDSMPAFAGLAIVVAGAVCLVSAGCLARRRKEQ